MSGFDDSDFVRLLEIIDQTEKERRSETAGNFSKSTLEDGYGDYGGSYDRVVSGLIFAGTEPDLIYGNIYIEDGIIKEIEELSGSQMKSRNWIVPRFINAHTHIGDTLLKDPPLGPDITPYAYKRDLDSLVRPPNGLKHRFLSDLSQEAAIDSMESAIWDMYQNGISVFADFREGGLSGVAALIEASKNAGRGIHPIIFGRPTFSGFDSAASGSDFSASHLFLDELRDLLDVADGIGVSGTNDLDEYILAKIAAKTQSKRRRLAIHAGEKDRSDIEPALSLDPDLLIHMTHAEESEIKIAADREIPIAVCVRSNLVTGVGLPSILSMLDAGISVCVGTDNVMLNAPDMFEELHFLSKIYGISDATLFKMATSNGADALGCRFTGSIEVGKKADMMVLNAKSLNLKHVKDPLAGFVRRARADDILGII
ncbi:amidohydrolase family protein [Methanimicrococcus blatticola]|uniref:Cytosine/adenosine deaminase-related metal-dependent hydrolase n=1 Tax=Methanimicrococcus blatticola TaxID=91560 RepID=A0A484F6Z3_9EURY|nr:amidohydrolase family protein [Methanimicrococcus blatticola]MBZ3935058.1 amidohydrolase family protein [Methanimicrococcus blatticola]MCC2508845.1 amidohydrolase family protein [Methanimicrococcus blatticola]TDQ71128.1 cytosine/adenosine deaminase-related metal-dependent hydrolase [Methanimicrococcus blatticola]